MIKIAKKRKEKKSVKDRDRGTTVAEGVGAVAGFKYGKWLHNKAMIPVVRSALKIEKGEAYDFNKLHDIVRGENAPKIKKINVPMHSFEHYAPESTVKAGLAPFGRLAGGKEYVAVSDRSAASAAHELAHSTSPFTKNKATHAMIGISGLYGQPVGAALGAYRGARGEKLSTGESVAMAAMQAPLLAEETRANILAYKALRQLHGGKVGLARVGGLIGSQLSYMGLASTPWSVNFMTRKAREGLMALRDKIDARKSVKRDKSKGQKDAK